MVDTQPQEDVLSQILWYTNAHVEPYQNANNYLTDKNIPDSVKPYIQYYIDSIGNKVDKLGNVLPKGSDILSPYMKTKQGRTSAAGIDALNTGALKYEADIGSRIDELSKTYWANQEKLLADIARNAANQKASIQGEAQEKSLLAQGMTSRRWAGSKDMEANTLADIQNVTQQQNTAVDTASIDKALAAKQLYEQLLEQLMVQYKDTKEKWTLNALTQTMATLNQINWYIDANGNLK